MDVEQAPEAGTDASDGRGVVQATTPITTGDAHASTRPRRLQLTELLDELGARDPDGDGYDAPRAAQLTVGELVDKASEAGFGFLVGILTLIAIPFFGLSTPFGIAIAIIGVQMILGRTKPWLPKRARRRQLSMTMLDKVAGILARRMRWIARSTKRRWEWSISTRLVGFGITVLALGLALPLPIPGSNMIFLIPIFIYAIGVLERDGVWVVVGHVAFLIDIALMLVFGNAVLHVLSKIWAWIT
ncbi:MAG: exopolysaccharide biosynthesis protein [Kofleriaceae bacterium]